MKKIFVILVALTCFGISANAQSCVIKGAEDGSTIEVQSCNMEGDNVIVYVINDSKDIAANVTVSVDVTYTYTVFGNTKTKTYSYSEKEIALARVSTKIVIPISKTHPSDRDYVANSVKPKSVSGTKCNSI